MLFIKLDLSELLPLKDLKQKVDATMKSAVRDLTVATHAHIIEKASSKLHSRRQMYIDSLSFKQVGQDTWVINLDAKARWIEDGMEPHNMLDALLKSPKAKTAKDGSKYLVVPFGHGPGKGPTSTTTAQQSLIQTIKSEMKERDIPFGKIERDQSGQAKLGKLHSFNVTDAPLKTANLPGQGKGPIGQVMQGFQQNQMRSGSGIPFLQGVNVYQKLVKGPGGKQTVKRAIMTFRIASSKHREQSGRWDHPGLKAVNLFEEAQTWALEKWEKEIAPGVVGKLIITLD